MTLTKFLGRVNSGKILFGSHQRTSVLRDFVGRKFDMPASEAACNSTKNFKIFKIASQRNFKQ